jgi:hypothetical protein
MQLTEEAIPTTDLPPITLDESPVAEPSHTDFDPEFPGSTPEAPYGYKEDGTPYKRRHGKRGKRTVVGGVVSSDKQARTAANMLGQINQIFAMALASGRFPRTAEQIAIGNDQFVEMAYQALLSDPALCRKILSAGTTSGKTGLVMAYGMLALSVTPTVRQDIQAIKREREEDAD